MDGGPEKGADIDQGVSCLHTYLFPIMDHKPEDWFRAMELHCMGNMSFFESVVLNPDGEGEADWSRVQWRIWPHEEYPLLECWVTADVTPQPPAKPEWVEIVHRRHPYTFPAVGAVVKVWRWMNGRPMVDTDHGGHYVLIDSEWRATGVPEGEQL